MSLLYSLLSGILAITAAKSDNVAPDYAHRDSEAAFWRGVFTSLGAVTFAYGGHSVLLEIQATLKAPPPPFESMMKGVHCSQESSLPSDYRCLDCCAQSSGTRRLPSGEAYSLPWVLLRSPMGGTRCSWRSRPQGTLRLPLRMRVEVTPCFWRSRQLSELPPSVHSMMKGVKHPRDS
jgi:hypothetical protein